MTKNKNMTLWDNVCQTDPSHTKHVGQRGGFTAIDAMYQVQTATEQFGPVGIGWGWDFELQWTAHNSVVCIMKLWHGKHEQFVMHVGQKALANKDGRTDEDAVKKAVTDALTKCLSYLGFNADVFLGKFDDNKYVQEMKAEFDPKAKEFAEWAKKTITYLECLSASKDLTSWLKNNRSTVDDAMKSTTTAAMASSVMSTYSKVNAELNPTIDPNEQENK